MRVLFTCYSAIGHFYPLVPIARAMAGAGHDAAFTATASFAPRVTASGFRCFQTSASNEDLMRILEPELRGLPPLAQRDVFRRRLFPEVAPQRLLSDLLALHADWAPDLVVSNNYEFAGRVAAECWNIPHASLKVVAGHFVSYGQRHALVAAMDALRALVGLPPDPSWADR